MNAQDRATIVQIGNALRANPTAWERMPSNRRDEVIRILRPRSSFDADQRAFLNNWWIEVTDEVVEQINAVLPRNHVAEPRTALNGKNYLGADLFTDAAEEGLRLRAIFDLIKARPIAFLDASAWPVEEGV